ncbi:hypothetical protein O6H91_09G069100 [Diphasiastrum complanatum]|nr:hypothetical protein O6H91_09G069100 [Diphasiastrum complanatum]
MSNNGQGISHQSSAINLPTQKQPLLRGGQRHRRFLTDTGARNNLYRHPSLREEVEHAAAETFLLTQLTLKLLRYLGGGYRWMTKLMALGLYAMLLMPGFIQIGWYYFFSNCVHRSIVYGDQPRNRLDLYLPENLDKRMPAVAFITGGAWIIGYKAWGSLLGKQLAERGIIVACIDYRNFPQGSISDMVDDVASGISFFCNNIATYGGDLDRLFLAGQSAGAHLAACALLQQAKKETCERIGSLSWSVSQFKAFFGISGPYNLPALVDHFHQRGLHRSIFLSIMEGEESLQRYSPELLVLSPEFKKAASLLPQIILFHGTADYSIPFESSINFTNALQSANATAKTRLYADKTHTDLFLQDPMRGGRDELLLDILAVVHAGDDDAETDDAVAPCSERLLPEILLQLARKVSPF